MAESNGGQGKTGDREKGEEKTYNSEHGLLTFHYNERTNLLRVHPPANMQSDRITLLHTRHAIFPYKLLSSLSGTFCFSQIGTLRVNKKPSYEGAHGINGQHKHRTV